MLIMTIGLLPAACRTQWNQEFTALERTGSGVSWRSSWSGASGIVMLMVPACPESGFLGRAARARPTS
jgi:hypothetical protein